MKKVLILTAGFGDGHNAAARNIRDALELLSEEVNVEVLDLFASTYGRLNSLARQTYLGLVQYAPALWGSVYAWLDAAPRLGKGLGVLARLKPVLGEILEETQPDCVVSTYPAYGHVLAELFRDRPARGFRFLTVVTDSISVNATWYGAPADAFCVANHPTAAVLQKAGVVADRIRVFGFPVSPVFASGAVAPLAPPLGGAPKKSST